MNENDDNKGIKRFRYDSDDIQTKINKLNQQRKRPIYPIIIEQAFYERK